ncbi:MAG: hypothetical protein Q7S22_03485 [Candidatus Micrarchaeota archaeon]|nr:hypothetical protein [Candidatus Micrarchaeota archaeon]
MNKFLSRKSLIFALLFIVLSVIGLRVNFSKLVGAENQFFTLFQFWGPIAGGFLGSLIGVGTVLVAQLLDFFVNGKQLTILNFVRVLPMLFGAYYFSKAKSSFSDNKFMLTVPLLAMLAFWLTPAGAGAWYFALFWLVPLSVITINYAVESISSLKLALSMVGDLLSGIPILGKVLKSYPQLFLLSLGATFVTHAVGGAIWAWSIPMTAAAWTALIPVVIYERLVFALGISISYVVFANVLNVVDIVFDIQKYVSIDKRYVL